MHSPTFLDVDDVLELHAGQIRRYGGSEGLRDPGLLESAVAQASATYGGKYLNPDLFTMAACYLFHLVKNHPFVDGNKRVGLESALVFLELNGLSVEAADDELVDLVLRTISGEKDKEHIAEFFRDHLASH